MKKYLTALISLCLFLSIAACGNKDNTAPLNSEAPTEASVQPSQTPASPSEEPFKVPEAEVEPEKDTNEAEEMPENSEGVTIPEAEAEETDIEYEPTIEELYGKGAVLCSTTEEFVAAIEDNAIIVLEPGTYDLSLWMKDNPLQSYIYGEEHDKGLYIDYDEFMLYGYNNITICSHDYYDPAEIVCEYSDAKVMSFNNCKEVYITGITFGHAVEPGSCSGDVLGFNDCYDINLYSCNLYGCGAYAFNINSSSEILVNNCEVYDCTYGCAYITSSDSVFFNYTEFFNCRRYDMFSLTASSASFYCCSFKRLEGELFALYGDSSVILNDCLYDIDAALSLINNQDYGTRIICYGQ